MDSWTDEEWKDYIEWTIEEWAFNEAQENNKNKDSEGII